MSDTRQNLMDAAMETVRTHGIKGTTARAIAATAGVNQALIFYHFDGVMDLLLTAAAADSAARAERYRKRLEGVDRLPDLAEVARQLHEDDTKDGGVAVFAQLLAGTAGDPDSAARLLEGFEPWIEIVRSALAGPLGRSGFDQLVPADDLAYTIVALFMGIEMLHQLDPDRSPTDALFTTFTQLGGLLDGVMAPIPASDQG